MATATRAASRTVAPDAVPSGRGQGRYSTRTIAAVICLLTVAVLFGAVARQSWSATKAPAEVVRLEAHGAEMLHPLTTLLTELVTAQSAAVRGGAVNQASVRSALAELQQPDALYGEQLETTERLAGLTEQIEAAFAAGETGRPAYDRYSSIVDLVIDLERVVGDTSHLVHDPELDSYYLMDAAIVRLPHAMVYAGRAADLVALAGSTGELTGEDAVRAAVARFNVSSDAEQVRRGLTTSIDFTARSQLGSNVAQRLDTFQAAADAFAPPTMLHELATAVIAGEMANNAARVSTAAQQLAHLLLSELQELLAARADGLAEGQRLTVIATGAAAVLGFATLILFALPRRRRGGGPLGDDADGGATTPAPQGFAVAPDLARAGVGRGGHAR